MKTLDECRKELNSIDAQMKELYLKRMGIVKEVALYKKAHNLATYDKSREDAMKENLSLDIDNELKKYYLEFLDTILKTSKDYQNEER